MEDTLFAGQNRIKLVTHCSSDSDYVAYLEREYIAYRILNIVSEYGYRVRKFQIRYEDTERDNVVEGNAFFIEDVDGVAARLGTSELEVPGIPIDELDREWQATLAVFQYLIANTDWAVTAAAEGEDCCHNMGVLAPIQRETGILTIPYDFDQSGFVNTAYATPPPNLPIRSVRQRMYRGLCVSQDYLGAAIDRFNQSRPEIEALFSDAELDDTDTRDALSYLAAGYEVLNDPEQRAQQIEAACRG